MTGQSSLERQDAVCAKHGSFQRVRIVLKGVPHSLGGCPTCADEQDAQHAARERARRVRDFWARAAIPARFASSTFATYTPTTERQTRAAERCRVWADDPERIARGGCLTLIGPPGTGKTHLLVATLGRVIDNDVSAMYSTAHEVLAVLRGQWSWTGNVDGKAFVTPTVLALDELFEPATPAEREAIVALVDERYQRRRPIIVGANLRWKEIAACFGKRMADRLSDGGEVLPLDGESHRKIHRDETGGVT